MALICKEGNLIDALLSGEVDFIAHCCNAQGEMNTGVAKEVKDRIPEAYEKYLSSYAMCENLNNDDGTISAFLGTVNCAAGVFNLIGQEHFGYDNKKYINYGALASAFYSLRQMSELNFNIKEITLGIPYKLASERAGGDWTIVLELVEFILVPYFKAVVVYKLITSDDT